MCVRVLNLYSGVGGNRRLWGDDVVVTAVEWDVEVARVYSGLFPDDRVVVDDAHEFLRHNFLDFDFVWSSPPCQSHSRVRFAGHGKSSMVFPDLRLYEEVLFLQKYVRGAPLWVVENVVPFYEPLVPAVRRGRHLFWSNFELPVWECGVDDLRGRNSAGALAEWFGFDLGLFGGVDDARQVLRNCVHPDDGLVVLNHVRGLLGG